MMAQWLYMIFDPSRPTWEGSGELFAENSPVVPCGFGVDFDVLRFGKKRRFSVRRWHLMSCWDPAAKKAGGSLMVR